MATHSSIPAWRISWTEEPGELQSMGWQDLDMTQRLNHHQYSPVYMYHIFIHSSVNGHQGCFHVLAIVNNAAVNVYLFRMWFPFNLCLGVGLLDHKVVLFLVFKGIFILFSTVALPIYISTNSLGGFTCLHILESTLKRSLRREVQEEGVIYIPMADPC